MTDALNREDLEIFTGAKTRNRQISVLQDARIPYIMRADGWPSTTWTAINAILIGSKTLQPNDDNGFDIDGARG